MKNKFSLLFVMVVTLMLSSCTVSAQCSSDCSNHDQITKTILVDDFSKIYVNASSATYRQGNENKIIYTVCEPIADKVEVYVKHGKLHIGIDKYRKSHEFKCEIIGTKPLTDISIAGACEFEYNSDVIVPGEVDIDISGSSNVHMNGLIKTPELDIDLSGASSIQANDIQSGEIDIDLSGASNAHLKGKCQYISLDTSGASKISAGNLVTKSAKIHASGASQIEITATGPVTQSTSGASRVYINNK